MTDKDLVFWGIGGGLVGLALGAVGIIALGGPRTDEVKIVREEGKPALMRIYRSGMDDILLQDSGNKDRFSVHLYQHLNNIKDEAERAIEEARIKKQVDWYDTHRSN